MDKKPVLVILIPGFAKDEEDSVCLPAQQAFVQAINKNFPHIEPVIFAFQYPFAKKEYSWHNNKVVAFGGRNRGGLSRLLTWRKVKKQFGELNKTHAIKGILSFWMGECAFIGNKLAKQYRLPQFTWLMGQDAKKTNRYVGRIKPAAASIIAISDFTREEFSGNHGIMPGHVIPLGVSYLPYKNEERNIDLLGVGSLIPLKKYDVFIQLVNGLKKYYPKIRTVICGKGPEEKKLKELIKKNDIEANVELAGELPHSKILEMMSRTRVFVHPSSFEGFSGVCLEALHAGAYVVSFCKPMKHEIANWHVVDSFSSMQERVIALLESRAEHYSVNAYPVDIAAATVLKLFKL